MGYSPIGVGDPAPFFRQRTAVNPQFAFDSAAGRYLVLCFFGSAGDPEGQAMLQMAVTYRKLFDDTKLAFFGISTDRHDEIEGRVADTIPGIRYFWDFDGSISRLYGALPQEAETHVGAYRRFWLVLDPVLRVRAVFSAKDDVERIAVYLECLPPVDAHAGFAVHAPVIILPNVFERAFCEGLVEFYERHGGIESGFMREIDGRTVAAMDHQHKRRADVVIEEDELKAQLRQRVVRRVIPEIAKVHQFHVTRMERYIVACYDSSNGGHFRPHRDNTTKGTAHRRFALSVNLNDEFDGGEVGFPEYGPRTYKAPVGGAVAFSCSLLHSVSPVSAGKRYAFLPFLYDDAAAQLRQANTQYLANPTSTP